MKPKPPTEKDRYGRLISIEPVRGQEPFVLVRHKMPGIDRRCTKRRIDLAALVVYCRYRHEPGQWLYEWDHGGNVGKDYRAHYKGGKPPNPRGKRKLELDPATEIAVIAIDPHGRTVAFLNRCSARDPTGSKAGWHCLEGKGESLFWDERKKEHEVRLAKHWVGIQHEEAWTWAYEPDVMRSRAVIEAAHEPPLVPLPPAPPPFTLPSLYITLHIPTPAPARGKKP